MLFVSRMRRAAPLMLAALALSVAACDPETPTRNDHPDIAAVRLAVGAQSLTVTAAGAQTGTLTLPRGDNAVVVTWLDSSGSAMTFSQVVTLQIVAVGAGSGVIFESAGVTGGRLTASTAGQKTVTIRFIHGDHPDFEANATFTVT